MPTVRHVLSASFEREGDSMPAEGALMLHIGEEQVGGAGSRHSPASSRSPGEGLNVGKDGGEDVTDDYPGDSPWAFPGGTIAKAIIDVSREPFVDLAMEAKAAFARD